MTALHLQAHPFYDAAGLVPCKVDMPQGLTIAQMLDRVVPAAERSEALLVLVRREGRSHELPAALWAQVRPREGSEILVVRMPEGNAGRAVAMIAVAAFAWWAAPYIVGYMGVSTAYVGIATTAVQAGITMVGQMAVNAAFPPPTPSGGGMDAKQWNQLTGTSNQINPGGAIPAALGQVRWFPPHAAIPYSHSVGEDSYQYCLFDLGHDVDPDDVSGIQIGSNPLSNFEGITYNITKTPTLYTNDVSEVAVGATLVDGDVVVRTTAPGVDQISGDIILPRGLFYTNKKGKDRSHGLEFLLEYRPAGTGSYTTIPAPRLSGLTQTGAVFKILAMKKDPFAIGFSFDVPKGQYDVRVTRVIATIPPGDGNSYSDMTQWSVLRSIRNVNPSTTDTTKLEMRIKSNGQLTGTLQTLSLVTFRKVPVYNETTQAWTRTRTANTGWVVLDLMRTHPATPKHVPDSRIALNTWLDYADFCTTNGFNTRVVVDSRLTMGELLREVMAGSLGRLSDMQGRYAAMFDAGDKVARDGLTTMETGGLTWSRAFIRRPHALRVSFRNPAANWEQDEIIVLDDGYSYRGVDARGNPSTAPEPTRFEKLDLRMIADAQQAWKLGRLQFGQARYQSATTSFTADISGMRYFRGDVIRLENDVMEWGAGSGWVVAVDGQTVRIDTEVETDPAKTYKAQVRRILPDGSQALDVVAVEPHSPITDTFYLPTGHTATVGDTLILSAVGQETAELMLTQRQSQGEKEYIFTAVPYDQRVAAYWANPPAVIVSEITGTTYTEAPDPPVVIAVTPGTQSDDAGIRTPMLSIGFTKPPSYSRTHYEELQR